MDISDESTATAGPSSKSPKRSLPGPSPNQISQNGGHENVELLRHSIANEYMASRLTHLPTSKRPPHSLRQASPVKRATWASTPVHTTNDVCNENMETRKHSSVIESTTSIASRPQPSASPPRLCTVRPGTQYHSINIIAAP